MKKLSMKKRVLGIAALLLLVGGLTACGNNPSGTYVVHVVTESGKNLEEVEVKVYTDSSKEDIVAVGETDENGLFSFESQGSVGDVIYLENVPVGYEVAENYEIKLQDTEIALTAQLLSEDELEDVTFKLGDVFADMSVTTSEGKVYTVSELLKEKKAVVINFWYLNCSPCKMEFPYLQEAYENYKDDIEVIAVNPVDGTDETIAAFQEQMELTFPMAACDAKWEQYMNLTAYPTTVVVDRYGTIGLIHKGMATSADEFNKVFEFFTAEDYEQTTIRNISELE